MLHSPSLEAEDRGATDAIQMCQLDREGRRAVKAEEQVGVANGGFPSGQCAKSNLCATKHFGTPRCLNTALNERSSAFQKRGDF